MVEAATVLSALVMFFSRKFAYIWKHTPSLHTLLKSMQKTDWTDLSDSLFPNCIQTVQGAAQDCMHLTPGESTGSMNNDLLLLFVS